MVKKIIVLKFYIIKFIQIFILLFCFSCNKEGSQNNVYKELNALILNVKLKTNAPTIIKAKLESVFVAKNQYNNIHIEKKIIPNKDTVISFKFDNYNKAKLSLNFLSKEEQKFNIYYVEFKTKNNICFLKGSFNQHFSLNNYVYYKENSFYTKKKDDKHNPYLFLKKNIDSIFY